MPSRNIDTLLRLAGEADYADLTSERTNRAAIDAYSPTFTLLEPPSLPQAGLFRGRDEWQAMHDKMRGLWQQKLTVETRWDVPCENVVAMRTTMEWTANATGRSAAWPTIELLWFDGEARIDHIEIFHSDTALILATLDDETRAAAAAACDASYTSPAHAAHPAGPGCTAPPEPSRNLRAYRAMQRSAEFESDITSDKSRQAMWDNFTDDYEIVEPASLPHGGVYKGREEWAGMNATMRSRWNQKVRPLHVWDVPDDDLIILYSEMEWTAKETGKTVTFPAVELLFYTDEKISKVEMFLQDTQVILGTLEP